MPVFGAGGVGSLFPYPYPGGLQSESLLAVGNPIRLRNRTAYPSVPISGDILTDAQRTSIFPQSDKI